MITVYSDTETTRVLNASDVLSSPTNEDKIIPSNDDIKKQIQNNLKAFDSIKL